MQLVFKFASIKKKFSFKFFFCSNPAWVFFVSTAVAVISLTRCLLNSKVSTSKSHIRKFRLWMMYLLNSKILLLQTNTCIKLVLSLFFNLKTKILINNEQLVTTPNLILRTPFWGIIAHRDQSRLLGFNATVESLPKKPSTVTPYILDSCFLFFSS